MRFTGKEDMYMVNSSFLFNNLYTKGFSDFKVDSLQPVRNIVNKNFLPIFYTSNIMELKTIYRMITLIKLVFHRSMIT